MAIDTADKQNSMHNIALGPISVMPLMIPDGTVSDADKSHFLNLYSGIALSEVVEIWTDAPTNDATWFLVNPTESTWDTETTFWDLDGNSYITLWDNIDDEWVEQTGNAVTWT